MFWRFYTLINIGSTLIRTWNQKNIFMKSLISNYYYNYFLNFIRLLQMKSNKAN